MTITTTFGETPRDLRRMAERELREAKDPATRPYWLTAGEYRRLKGRRADELFAQAAKLEEGGAP